MRVVNRVAKAREYISAKLLQASERLTLPDKYKGGRLEKWGNYWQGVYADYREVARDVVTDARQKPYKAMAITAGLGLLTCSLKTNPDEESFRDNLLNSSNSLLLLDDSIRNRTSANHVSFLFRCYNEGLIRRFNFGVCSVMWIDNYDAACGLYAAQCPYLTPSYLRFYERIVDVGALGFWFILPARMNEFDINPDEWKEK